MKRLLIIICTITLLIGKAYAENLENIPTMFINSEMGLVGETVSKIISDRHGQRWVATSNGVNCYNGIKTTTIPVPNKQPGRNYVFDICAGEDDCIYIATEKGIFKLAPYENEFSLILPSISKAETLLEAKGKLYIGNRDGLTVTDGNKILNTIHVVTSPMSIENGVRDICEDEKGNIWFTSRYAINCYNPKTGKFTTNYYLGSYDGGLRRINVKQKPGSYIAITRTWNDGDIIKATYPMSLHLEKTPDNPKRAALLYGPVVLAGEKGTEGMQAPASFSNPQLYNDYYTYDYHVPANLKTSITVNERRLSETISRPDNSVLHFTSKDGESLRPLYDIHRQRYVVYWNLK